MGATHSLLMAYKSLKVLFYKTDFNNVNRVQDFRTSTEYFNIVFYFLAKTAILLIGDKI